MSLKAVLLDFNGVVINDEPLHRQIICDLLLEENLRPNLDYYNQDCLGRSDKACITALMHRRGRVVTEAQLAKLLERKANKYEQMLGQVDPLPVYPGLEDLIYQIRVADLKLAIVSGARQQEIEWVLAHTGIRDYVNVIVSADDLSTAASKPAPDGYQLAIQRLNQHFPALVLGAAECLAIEDSFAGIEAAKRAGVGVLGVAHTYPYQMIHRRADWVVDHLYEIQLDWLQRYYGQPSRSDIAVP
jgi:beta-phosphoglucomutase